MVTHQFFLWALWDLAVGQDGAALLSPALPDISCPTTQHLRENG